MNDLVVVEKLEGWEKLKTLVLDSVSSPITKRVYNMALNEFLAWLQQAPWPGFTKATVSAWRVSLEARGLGSSSVIIRMSAIRKLAAGPGAFERAGHHDPQGAARSRDLGHSSRLRAPAIRSRQSYVHASPTTLWTLVEWSKKPNHSGLE